MGLTFSSAVLCCDVAKGLYPFPSCHHGHQYTFCDGNATRCLQVDLTMNETQADLTQLDDGVDPDIE